MDQEAKVRQNKRKIAYVYLMHRMFEGSPVMLMKIMKVPGLKLEDLQDWDAEYHDAVRRTIEEEDSRGVKLKDETDVPSIKSIKEKLLRRVDGIINETTDPSRLATTYKVLSEFEGTDDRKEKSVLDAINDMVKPAKQKKTEMKTMLDKMRQQKGFIARNEEGDGEETENEE